MAFVRPLGVLALILSSLWFAFNPGFEPGITIVASIIALISDSSIRKKRDVGVKQKQSTKNSSVGIQAGKDVNIRDSFGDNDE